MRVLLTSDARFERTADGAIWGAAGYCASVWRRYLEVFSSVLVAARVADVSRPSSGNVPASGPNIAFCALPPYAGLARLLRHAHRVRAMIAEAMEACPAVIVRSPSPIAYLAARTAVGAGRVYGAQVVGDPDQVFSPGAFRHPLRVPLRSAGTAMQRYVAGHATAVQYVTREVLQRKYPTGGWMFVASDVVLDDDAFGSPQTTAGPHERFTVVTVAALDQPYKGTAVLLDAIGQLVSRGMPLRLLVVGGGGLLPALQAQAASLGIAAHVEFLGQRDRSGVFEALHASQLFVLPSLTEGLPRALLEAMACGLPAIATDVGGIPELLPPECLVRARDARDLARKIDDVARDAAARASWSTRNRDVARRYHERVQAPIRTAFLLAVRAAAGGEQQEIACA